MKKEVDWAAALEDWNAVEKLEFDGVNGRDRRGFHVRRSEAHEQLASQTTDVQASRDLLDKARGDLEIACRLDDDHDWRLRSELGRLQLKTFRGGEARTSFQECLDRFTGSKEDEAKLSLGMAMAIDQVFPFEQQEESLQEGFRRLTRCQDLGRDDFEVRKTLGNLYRHMRKYDLAVQHYVVAAQKKRDDVDLLYWLGACLCELKRHEDAVVILTAAANLPSASLMVKQHRAIVLKRLNRLRDFQEALDDIRMSNGPDAEMAFIEAAVLSEDAPLELIARVDNLSKMADDNPFIYAYRRLLGIALVRADKPQEAIDQMNRLQRELTTVPESLPDDDKKRAVDLWKMLSVEGVPGQPYDWIIMAMAHLEKNETEEAETWLRRARAGMDRAPITVPRPDHPDYPIRYTASSYTRHTLQSDTWFRREEVQILLDEVTRRLATIQGAP